VGHPVIQFRSIVDELDGLVGGDESSDRGDKTWDADLGRHLKSGVEVSVSDLLAQREGVPPADLFGKRRRDACPVNAYGFWHFDPAGTDIKYLPPEGRKAGTTGAAPAMTILMLVAMIRTPAHFAQGPLAFLRWYLDGLEEQTFDLTPTLRSYNASGWRLFA